jgi:hypothetical protein
MSCLLARLPFRRPEARLEQMAHGLAVALRPLVNALREIRRHPKGLHRVVAGRRPAGLLRVADFALAMIALSLPRPRALLLDNCRPTASTPAASAKRAPGADSVRAGARGIPLGGWGWNTVRPTYAIRGIINRGSKACPRVLREAAPATGEFFRHAEGRTDHTIAEDRTRSRYRGIFCLVELGSVAPTSCALTSTRFSQALGG